MFGKQKEKEPVDYAKRLADIEHQHKIAIAELQNTHKLEMKEKEFELKHFKDEELRKAQGSLNEEKQKNAVLKKENEMLQKITDLNADIIDIKDLVNKLVEKLPTINLSSLTVQNGVHKE